MNKNFIKLSKLGELSNKLNAQKIIAEIYLSFLMPE